MRTVMTILTRMTLHSNVLDYFMKKISPQDSRKFSIPHAEILQLGVLRIKYHIHIFLIKEPVKFS